MQRMAWSVAIAVALTGCVSTPNYRYYTLDMRQGANLGAPVWIEDVRLEMSDSLSRPAIMIRTSPTEIVYYALDRWASGLQSQIGEKLKTEFAPSNQARYTARIDGALMAFEQVDAPPGADVHLKAELTTTIREKDTILGEITRIYDVREHAAAANPDAVVQALSKATEQLAAALSEDMRGIVNSAHGNQASGTS